MSTMKTTKTEPKAADKADALKKADGKATAAKTAVTKAAEAVKAAPAETKPAEKKTPGRKPAAAKAAEKKTPGRKPAAKKAVAEKKAPVKRAARAKEEVFIEYAGSQVSTADIVARVVEATGKKASAIKALNVYVQPETGKIYYTADGESGEIAY